VCLSKSSLSEVETEVVVLSLVTGLDRPVAHFHQATRADGIRLVKAGSLASASFEFGSNSTSGGDDSASRTLAGQPQHLQYCTLVEQPVRDRIRMIRVSFSSWLIPPDR